MIFFILPLIVQFCTAPIEPQYRTIPIVSDQHGNLFFGDPFQENEAQSPTDESHFADDVPYSTELSHELFVELSPVHVSQPKVTSTLSADEDIESLSAHLYHPSWTLVHSAEAHQIIADPEAHQREVSSTLSQEKVATDTDTESTDMGLGTLLDCVDLGSLSVDGINIEMLLIGTEMGILLNDTLQAGNASMTIARYRLNISDPLARLQVPASSSDSTNKEVRNVDEQRGTNLACQGLSGSACEKKSVECDMCQKLFRNPSDYQRHRRIHTSEKSFKCDLCQKELSEYSSYQRHRRTHTSEKRFQCDICPRQFRYPKECRIHRRIHAGEKPFKCEFCQKEFSNPSSYQRHRRIHTGENTLKCDFCQKKFCNPSSYQRHHRIHTDEKPFKCDFCQKEFNDKSSYQRHLLIHRDEKPFQCDICSKQFRNNDDKQKHRRIHTGEKPFQCDICSKQFRISGDYQNHRRIHTGEKPFQCDICSKVFRTSSNYQKHRRTHAAH